MRRFRPTLWGAPSGGNGGAGGGEPASLVSYDVDAQSVSESFMDHNIGASATPYVPVVAAYMYDSFEAPSIHYVDITTYGANAYDRVYGTNHSFAAGWMRARMSGFYLSPTGADIRFESNTFNGERYGIAAVFNKAVDFDSLTENVVSSSASLSVSADSATFGFATEENAATPTSITDMTPVATEVRPAATTRWFEIAVPEVETGARTVTLGSSGTEAIVNVPFVSGGGIGLTFEDYYTSPDATPGSITLGSTPSASDEFLVVGIGGWTSPNYLNTLDGQSSELLALFSDGNGRFFSLSYVTGVTSASPVVTWAGSPLRHAMAIYKVTGFSKQKVSVQGTGLHTSVDLTPQIYCEDGGAVLGAFWLDGTPANFGVSGLDTTDVDEVLMESPRYVSFGRLTASDALAGVTITQDGANSAQGALFFIGS